MNRIIDFIFSCIEAREFLRPRRSDDHFMAEWRSRWREVAASVVWVLMVFVLGFAVAGFLNTLGELPYAGAAVDSYRAPTSYAFLAGLAISSIRLGLALWGVHRFARDGRI